MEKKIYSTPELEVICILTENILNTSTSSIDPIDPELPPIPLSDFDC